jgi:hypothetical protein
VGVVIFDTHHPVPTVPRLSVSEAFGEFGLRAALPVPLGLDARNLFMETSIPFVTPGRSARGRTDRAKVSGLTPEGRRRLREAALANRPWDHATGPRTAVGKARSAANGAAGRGPRPNRDFRRELEAFRDVMAMLARARSLTLRHLASIPSAGAGVSTPRDPW